MIETLRTLLARLQAAREPDRMLDADVALAFGQPQAFFAQFNADVDGNPCTYEVGGPYVDGPRCYGDACWGGGGRAWKAPAYTASVDAALALIDAVLPGCAWGVSSEPPIHGRTFHAFVGEHFPQPGRGPRKRGQSADYVPTAALALCQALIAERLAILAEQDPHP